jgi:hypothetical protein
MRRLDPKLDIVFKLLFLRNPGLLRSLLEAVLDRTVTDFEVLNPEVPGEFPADKAIVLDTRVRLDGGERVDVEMQARGNAFLAERFLFYATRDYSGSRRAAVPLEIRAARGAERLAVQRSPHRSRAATAGDFCCFRRSPDGSRAGAAELG